MRNKLGLQSLAAYHDGRHDWTMITCEARRLAIKTPDVQPRQCSLAIYSLVLCSWNDTLSIQHPPVAFVFKMSDSPLQIHSQSPAPTSVQQHWQDQWFVVWSVLLALSRLKCACVSLTFDSFTCVFSLRGSQVSELVHFFWNFSIHPHIDEWPWLDAIDEDFVFVELIFILHPAAVFSSL